MGQVKGKRKMARVFIDGKPIDGAELERVLGVGDYFEPRMSFLAISIRFANNNMLGGASK